MMVKYLKFVILKWILNMIGSLLDVVCGLISLLTLTMYRPWWDYKFRCYSSKLLLKANYEKDFD